VIVTGMTMKYYASSLRLRIYARCCWKKLWDKRYGS